MDNVPPRSIDRDERGTAQPRSATLHRRLSEQGAESLEPCALIAICSGLTGDLGLAAASRLAERFDLLELSQATADHIRVAGRVPGAAAGRVAAAFELGRRVRACVSVPRTSLRSPARVHELLAAELRGLSQETFHVLLLDGKHRLRRRQRVSSGTLTASLVHPREVFGPALREGAAALIAAHNHPSGDPEPSPEDLAITRRLIEAGRILGVPLLDHVVVGADGFVSIRERISFQDP